MSMLGQAVRSCLNQQPAVTNASSFMTQRLFAAAAGDGKIVVEASEWPFGNENAQLFTSMQQQWCHSTTESLDVCSKSQKPSAWVMGATPSCVGVSIHTSTFLPVGEPLPDSQD